MPVSQAMTTLPDALAVIGVQDIPAVDVTVHGRPSG